MAAKLIASPGWKHKAASLVPDLRWDPIWDTLRMLLIVLVAGAQLADLAINGGWGWAAAILAVVFVGMAS